MTSPGDSVVSAAPEAGAAPAREGSARRVAIATLIGSLVEYYDFFLYGTAAALVFPALFFPNASTTVGILLSFATLGVGFVARPIGALLFGHFGDRLGRKKMLVISITLMGGATVAMGLLPTYEKIGIVAPVLLVVLRLLQGGAVGGEWGGAVLMAVEHAPAGRKGLYGGFPIAGAGLGNALAACAFVLVTLLPDDALMSWGWRVPFVASVVLVVIGMVIRLRLAESPEFHQVEVRKQVQRLPVVEVLRRQWRSVLLVVGVYISQGVFTYIFIAYLVSYSTREVGLDPTFALVAVTAAGLVSAVTYPLGGALSDRIGRKSAYLIGVVASGALAAPAFVMVNTGNPWLFLLAQVLVMGVALAPMAGVTGTLFATTFDTDIRYSGASIGYTLSQLAGSAFAPTIAAALYTASGSSYSIVGYLLVASLISLVAVVLLPGRLGRGEAQEQRIKDLGGTLPAAR